MSMLLELVESHFPLQDRPPLCHAVDNFSVDIYSEPGVFLLGFQAPYHHFTIWHAHSAA